MKGPAVWEKGGVEGGLGKLGKYLEEGNWEVWVPTVSPSCAPSQVFQAHSELGAGVAEGGGF